MVLFMVMFPVALASFLSLLWAQNCAAAAIAVDAQRDGEALIVEASAELAVPIRQAWDVLTDYEHLSDFVPDLNQSRVIERTGDHVVVEQMGLARFLFFRFPVSVRMEIVERPPTEVVARAVKGSFQEMTGRYALAVTPVGVKLTYVGRFVPNFGFPRMLENAALKQAVTRQFGALVQEIERRAAIAGARDAGRRNAHAEPVTPVERAHGATMESRP